jgi:ketosteroid isomerase-like protein
LLLITDNSRLWNSFFIRRKSPLQAGDISCYNGEGIVKNTFAFLYKINSLAMNKVLLFAFGIILLNSCNFFQKKKNVAGPEEKQKMMEADRAFSKMSVEKGMKTAFLEYIDSNGVLLRPNQLPIVGADAIDYLIQINDTLFTMQWEPKYGAIAQSGELGYTYGLYALKSSARDTTLYGTYVSIWKKQADGSWKFVLDSGNEGVGEAKE